MSDPGLKKFFKATRTLIKGYFSVAKTPLCCVFIAIKGMLSFFASFLGFV